jgi:hypothetical protein
MQGETERADRALIGIRACWWQIARALTRSRKKTSGARIDLSVPADPVRLPSGRDIAEDVRSRHGRL